MKGRGKGDVEMTGAQELSPSCFGFQLWPCKVTLFLNRFD